MNTFSWLQLVFYLAALIALARPLGGLMARVYQSERTFLDPVLRPVERLIYRASGVTYSSSPCRSHTSAKTAAPLRTCPTSR